MPPCLCGQAFSLVSLTGATEEETLDCFFDCYFVESLGPEGADPLFSGGWLALGVFVA